ncbi:MAG: restriction endonuclease subunit S [Xenococcaceae cyanobacterium]
METVDLLDKYFETAFAAPDGIKRLRELILTLAMQGKLVPQNPKDRSANELLKEIEAEKKRLIKEGKIKKSKPLSEITPDEIPYDLPESWEWVRLGNITEYNGRINVQSKDILDNTWLLDLEDIEKDTSRIIYRAKYFERQSKSTKSTFKKGDVLYGKLRPYLNKVVVADNDGICTTEIVPIIPYSGIDSHFLKWLLKRPLFLVYVNSLMYGVKMPRLGTDDAIESIHPLPPLPEQHRIVEKIDRLMEQVDRLEKLQEKRDRKRLIIHAAASDPLLNALDKNSFNDAWNFIQENFNELYSVKENISELRKAILQLAVMGKLVPQNPNDPPASELLKEIEAEKKRLIKEGKIKKQKPLPEIKPEEIPYQVPENWEWSNIQNISLKVTDGEHKTPIRSDRGYYLLSARNVTNEGIKLDKVDYVLEEEYTRIRKRCNPEIGDILISCSGSVGRVSIVDSNEYVMVRSVALIKHKQDLLSSSFFAYVMRSPFAQYQIEDKSRTTAQSNLFLGKINEILIPLPPLPEQHRIVAKVDRLMALCDRLEAQLTKQTEKQTALLNVVTERCS